MTFIGNYWVYHRGTADDYEEEKVLPSSKAWHVVKYVSND